MAVNNYKDAGGIIKFGGGSLVVREVDDDGTNPSADTYDLGYIQDTGLRFETAVEDIQDESGATITSTEGNDTVKLEGMFMQSNKLLIDFLRDNTRGVYYQVYYKMSPTAQMMGKTQELFIGIIKIKRMIDVKANTKRIPFEFTVLQNASEISITTPQAIYSSVASATVTIGAREYYNVVET